MAAVHDMNIATGLKDALLNAGMSIEKNSKFQSMHYPKRFRCRSICCKVNL